MLSVELRPARPIAHALGGRLSLALVNSVLWRRSGEPIERLADYHGLAGYVRDAGGIDDAALAALEAEATADPTAARAALERALNLREALFRLFSAVAAGVEPDGADVAVLDRAFRAGLRQVRVGVGAGRGFRPGWTGLDVPAWEAAVDAVAVLGSPDAPPLKQCPGETCGWLFVDESRNHSRQWCDSRMCGNRARARRHYQKQRAG
ncbi:CGNR zinc finger domain-containing protein [Asanoa sp. WMMD1127]|uniref:CGNR zinc finger domain-containing protein n=1 Tax=Asanoa sp. WMMD1127 TaxID=3016107 RepID=UPI00241772A9|nr:CGNR zinc finger domain-containing protein [Asanoa sp. WMMD1127]MDG4823508.1 CGNR zinc finger domain-containing protein [Asanoa sp. WMMD1127]